MLKQLLKNFNWKDIGERSVKTFIEIFLAIAGVDTVSGGFIDDELSATTKYILIIITSVVGTILCTVINIIKHMISAKVYKECGIDIDLDTGEIGEDEIDEPPYIEDLNDDTSNDVVFDNDDENEFYMG